MPEARTDTRGNRPILTRNKFLAYFLCIIIGFFACLLLARLTFPGDYSILENSVSTLGVFEENPGGWYFFTLSLWIAAVGLLPYYHVLFKLTRAVNQVLAVIMVILYLITSTGLFMAGLFQEGSHMRSFHLLSAYLGFGGFFIAGIFTWILSGNMIARTTREKSTLILLYIAGIASLSVGAGLFITHLVLEEAINLDFSGAPISPFIGFPFTEWLLVITIFVDKLLIGLVMASFLQPGKPPVFTS